MVGVSLPRPVLICRLPEGMNPVVHVIALDVNETLLDLRALDQPLEELLGRPGLLEPWFAQMLQLSFVGGLTGSYVDFTSAQIAALQMIAQRHGVGVTDIRARAFVEHLRRLPPHPDVRPALQRLSATGLRVVALVNSPVDVGREQIENAGLSDVIEDVVSADAAGRLKPAPEPYRAVAAWARADLSQVRLVAAHAWDVSGALAAGCRAAFVARPGKILSPLGEQPDLVGPDLGAVVDQILERDVPRPAVAGASSGEGPRHA